MILPSEKIIFINVEILKMLLAAREYPPDKIAAALMLALDFKNIPASKFLMTKKFPVNYQDKFQFTPLHVAAGNANNPELTEKLLKLGADPYLKNHTGADVFEWVQQSATGGDEGPEEDFSKVQAVLQKYRNKKNSK